MGNCSTHSLHRAIRFALTISIQSSRSLHASDGNDKDDSTISLFGNKQDTRRLRSLSEPGKHEFFRLHWAYHALRRFEHRRFFASAANRPAPPAQPLHRMRLRPPCNKRSLPRMRNSDRCKSTLNNARLSRVIRHSAINPCTSPSTRTPWSPARSPACRPASPSAPDSRN